MLSLDLHFENKIEKINVPQNIELPELLKKLEEKTGCSEVAKLEEFDKDFQTWLEVEQLSLYDGAKLKVTKKSWSVNKQFYS